MSSSGGTAPFKLHRKLVERPWGGEVWFTADRELPLLIKFIYTHQALSFQVHPGDQYATEHHKSRGKTEMWYIVSAAPKARIAFGFRESVTRERLREAALTGEIEQLVNWVVPRPGDAFFTPAGTIHAIGGGIELWEIQQHSDITYRLYDYGRPRELHLDKAIQVASTEASKGGATTLPIDCKYFHAELARITTMIEYPSPAEAFHLLVFAGGMGTIAGQPFREGETWLVPPEADPFSIKPHEPTKFLRTWVP